MHPFSHPKIEMAPKAPILPELPSVQDYPTTAGKHEQAVQTAHELFEAELIPGKDWHDMGTKDGVKLSKKSSEVRTCLKLEA